MNGVKKDEPASESPPAIDPRVGGSGRTRVVAGVLVPDTPLITSAIEYARENSEPYLFNLAGPFLHLITNYGVAMRNLKCFGLMLFVALSPFTASFADTAAEPVVTPIMLKDLADTAGKEMLMLTVIYPPGAVEHIHRHDAHAFVYVLEGSIIEGVRGGKEVTLTPGQTFYEGPGDVHTVGRNASKTKPAKFVVVLLKKKGVDAVLPAE
jgi:quercetin dioxygenase-like cupin family protein